MATPRLGAQSVAWGGSTSNNQLSFDSHGNADLGVLTWELGWFADGYSPNATNFATWADNWNSVDVGAFTSAGPPGPPGPFLSANLFLDNLLDAPVGTEGKQMYTFVHNGGTTDAAVWGPLMGTPNGEALIYTLGQTFKGTGIPTQSFNIADNPTDPNDDLTVIWGRVDRYMYADDTWPSGSGSPPADGGVIWNAGVISNPIANSVASPANDLNGTFENQTATWIPEPASALLVVLGGALTALRRRREV